MDLLVDAIIAVPGITLLLRPHPSMSDTNWIAREAASRPHVIFSPATHNLHDIIRASDAVVTQGSTVGIEALALNKPVILCPATHTALLNGSYDTPAVLKATTKSELNAALHRLTVLKTDEGADDLVDERQRFITDYLYKLDGGSAARVAAELGSLMSLYRMSRSKEKF
ncbi:hypothetical protein HC891_00640 [Candidatus Gracilibacteria bacterium]|nr:hypothetical protein [Candidatus Gracilibacteria bacterium]